MPCRLILGVTLLFWATVPLFLLGCGGSSPAQRWFEEGNRLYAAGDYDGAIRAYERSLRSGGIDGKVYFNLGNAYLAKGVVGEAVLFYERAKHLLPRDDDLDANLQATRRLLKDVIQPRRVGWGERWLLSVASWFNLNEAVCLSSFFYFLLVVSLSLRLVQVIGGLQRRTSGKWRETKNEGQVRSKNDSARSARLIHRATLIVGTLFSLSLLLTASRFVADYKLRDGIITSREATVRSGPSDRFPESFRLHEGTKVRLCSERGIWWQIEVGGGLRGWLKEGEFQPILR